jgi:hypothetical protein
MRLEIDHLVDCPGNCLLRRRIVGRELRASAVNLRHQGVSGAEEWRRTILTEDAFADVTFLDHLTEGRGTISPDLADTVADAYDHLWNRDPPATTAGERQAGDKARSRAVMGRSAPPLAWDDDKIDLLDGKPENGWKPSCSRCCSSVLWVSRLVLRMP